MFNIKQKFISVLQFLCLSYDEQRAFFKDYVYVPEGIVSIMYDDMFEYDKILLEQGVLTSSVYREFRALKDLVDKFVDCNGIDFPLEYLESLEWQQIVSSAKAILLKMGETLEPPDRNFI
jgi:hypothetical protein